MKFMLLKFLSRIATPVALVAALALPAHSKAQAATSTSDQDHIVSSQALQQQVEASSSTRQKNIETLNQFVSTPTAQKAMRDAHIDAQQVKTAIPTLSDRDLANLAARATNAQQEFAAGHLGPSLYTLVVIAVILLIVLIVIH